MEMNQAELESLTRWFLGDLSKLRDVENPGIDDVAIIPLVEVWHNLLDWASHAKLSAKEVGRVVSQAQEAEKQVKTYKASTGDAKALAAAALRDHLDVFPTLFDELIANGSPRADFDRRRAHIRTASDEMERSLSIVTYVTKRTESLDSAVAAAKAAAEAAEDAAKLAEKAATTTATSRLEQSFASTAKTSSVTAWVFRGATVATLVAVVLLGLDYALKSSDDSVDNWHAVVYRVAILSGLAAIAAYLGRQASNYHRISTWARAIEIQLKAFLGFVNEIKDEEARQTMYALFAKRVLEAPPDGKASNDEVTNLIQPLVDQASKFRTPT